MKACFKKLLDGDSFCLFFFKQVNGALFGAILGAFITFIGQFGFKAYNSFTHQPICKISPPEKNSIGYVYKWDVLIKDKNQGGFLLYPKDDALIIHSSIIDRPLRITEAHNIGEHKNGGFSRGIKFIYIEGSEPLRLKFETYSDKQLNISNTKDATCEDLLSNL